MKKLSLLLSFFAVVSIHSQTLEAKFDSILASYDGNQPGLAAGVIQDGKILYLKGFGVEDVETKVPITTQTKFQVDDLAKQFTLLGILILEDQKKLSFEDDIRMYLPDLPKYSNTVQIKHLVNHTSGLYNLDPIKELHQIDSGDTFTQEDALKLIFAQEKLNFTPGTQFSYHRSDTEVLLLVEIIEKVSKLKFTEFMTKEVFQPLGMKNTTFQSDFSILNHTAKSYTVGEEVSYNPRTDLTLGVTNLFTTAKDLAKWFQQYSNQEKLSQLVKKLDTYVKLDSGEQYDSTWGSMTVGRYYDHPERGLSKMSWQFGLVNGYGANFFRFQSHNVISFVLGNNNRYNGMPAMLLANQIMEENYTEPSEIDYRAIRFTLLDSTELKKYEGFYWDTTNGLVRQIYMREDTLRYKRLNGNRETAILPRSKIKFQLYVQGDTEVFVTFYKDRFEFSSLGSMPMTYHKIDPLQNEVSEVDAYTGLFYNQEFDLVLHLNMAKDLLEISNFQMEAIPFYPIVKDHFRSNTFMLSGIEFIRNSENEVTGFEIHTDGIQGLIFKRLKS